MPVFTRYIGIDYSGAEAPIASLKGLRVYLAKGGAPPTEDPPPPGPRKYWTRKGIAEWLVERLADGVPTLVGIDHGFSFPLRYFDEHGLPHDWPAFLDDFQRHWPTDGDNTYVDFVRDGSVGNGTARMGNARWRRLTEERAGSAKSVFHFDVQGQVAKSTHAGIPWLRFIRQRLGPRVHFWPFDGWNIPVGRSAIAEVYPALWSHGFARERRTGDQHDAFSIAAWLSRADRDGTLAAFLQPDLTPPERAVAQVEGWILGVPAVKVAVSTGRKSDSSRAKQPAPSGDVLLLARAWRFAAEQHTDQRRKGAREEPYVNHVAEVAELVAEATQGRDPNLVAAAVLHDTIEDTGASQAQLEQLFNADVAAMVAEVTDDKSLEKQERKRLQIEHAAHKSPRARVLKLADKTSNLRALAKSPPKNWSLERRQDYLRWARDVAAGLRGANPWLEQQFDAAAAALEQALGTQT